MTNKFLNKLNLAVIVLAMTFATYAQAQSFSERVHWVNCHIDIVNPATKNKQRILIEPFPVLHYEDRLRKIEIYISFENNVGIGNVFPGYERDYGFGRTCFCGSGSEKKEDALRFHESKKREEPAHIIVIYQPPIEETGIAPTKTFSIKNRPNINPEKSSDRGGITIKEIPYESTTKAAVERVTLAMKQKEAEEKVKKMAIAAKSAKLQVETDRLIKLQTEKMKLRGRRQ
jgi:hypothetical protein